MSTCQRGGRIDPASSDDGGYLMVALLIGMAVTAIWMGSLLPSWHQQAMREKEAELVFRGEQYARAIALYRRKTGTLPPNIDVLVSQHYLRRKYLDPITGKDFLPIGGISFGSQTGASLTSGGGGSSPTGRGGGAAARGGSPSGLGGDNTGAAPATLPSGGRGLSGAPGGMSQGMAPSTGLSQAPGAGGFFGAAAGAGAGISGVRSTSNDTSIRVYYGQQTYSQWAFDWTTVAARMGQTAGPAGVGIGQPNGPRFGGSGGAGAVSSPGALGGQGGGPGGNSGLGGNSGFGGNRGLGGNSGFRGNAGAGGAPVGPGPSQGGR